MKFYDWIYKTFRSIVMRVYRVEVVGAENIPSDGAIVAANHTAFSDVIILSAAMGGRQIRYMAKKELFKTPLAPLITALGAYPVDRGGADVKSLKTAIGFIEGGQLVGIFPQGHRRSGEDLRQSEIKAGMGMIAYHSKAKILPVLIDNDRMKTGLFRKNRVTFGRCVSFDELGMSGGGREQYMKASRLVFDKICEMKYGPAACLGEPSGK